MLNTVLLAICDNSVRSWVSIVRNRATLSDEHDMYHMVFSDGDFGFYRSASAVFGYGMALALRSWVKTDDGKWFEV